MWRHVARTVVCPPCVDGRADALTGRNGTARCAQGKSGLVPSNYVKELKSSLAADGLLEADNHTLCIWFHGRISRDVAQEVLAKHRYGRCAQPPRPLACSPVCRQCDRLRRSTRTGYFLVRESIKFTGEYTLSLCCNGELKHYRIQRDARGTTLIGAVRRASSDAPVVSPGGFTMGDTDEDPSFSRIDQLIEHYTKEAGGLPVKVRVGASEGVAPPAINGSVPADAWACAQLSEPCINSTRQFFHYKQLFEERGLEVDRDKVDFGKTLGSGQFGDVWEGVFSERRVAIKTLKEDNMLAVCDFFHEAHMMSQLDHENIVKLLGVSTNSSPLSIIVEFMCFGDLQEHLRSRGRAVLKVPDLLSMAIQVCSAMVHIASKRIIHRDLAARNILVGENDIVKVGDFGLAVQLDGDAYIAPEGARFPTKWYTARARARRRPTA